MKRLGRAVLAAYCVVSMAAAVRAQDVPAAKSPAPAAAAATPAYADDPKFQKALAEAKEKKPMTPDERLARWKHVSKIAKGECVECVHQLLLGQMNLLQWKDAISTANDLERIAVTNPDKYFAVSEHGMALMHLNNGNPKPDQVKEADTYLQAALKLFPKSKPVIWSDGRALALLGRDDEAKAMFERYLAVVPYSDSYRTRAEHFAENPHLATLNMAPAFTLTTSEGEQMALDDMGGKVVLLDFWATWCGPCKESLPEVKRIAKDFAGQPFVVISISMDSDDFAWKTFIDKNQMTWPQYRDKTRALTTAYQAESIPRYFTIDTDGVLQSVKIGSGNDPENEIRALLKKAVAAEKKKALASDKASN